MGVIDVQFMTLTEHFISADGRLRFCEKGNTNVQKCSTLHEVSANLVPRSLMFMVSSQPQKLESLADTIGRLLLWKSYIRCTRASVVFFIFTSVLER